MCFVRWLQFGQNLEELAHGVRPGHADILVLEYEEVAIPRPGLFLPTFMALLPTFGLKVGRETAIRYETVRLFKFDWGFTYSRNLQFTDSHTRISWQAGDILFFLSIQNNPHAIVVFTLAE